MNRSHGLLVSCGVIAGVVAAAHAEQVYVEMQGLKGNIGRGVQVTLGGGLEFWDGSTTRNVWAGERSGLLNGKLTRLYSAELTARTGDGWFDRVGVEPMLGDTKAAAIHSLFGAASGDLGNREQAAAFQALLWEIVYDFDGTPESIDLASGHVRIDLVNSSIFAAMKSDTMRGGGSASLEVIANQSFGDHFRIIPLPSGAALAGAGLLGLGLVRRRD